MRLVINENKTKYIVMTRNTTVKDNLSIGLTFEQVEDFQYLEVNINKKNNIHKEIRMRLNAANRRYFKIKEMFSSKLLLKRTKERLYCTHLKPIVTTHVKHGLPLKEMKKGYRVLRGKQSRNYLDRYINMPWKVTKEDQTKTCNNCIINRVYDIS